MTNDFTEQMISKDEMRSSFFKGLQNEVQATSEGFIRKVSSLWFSACNTKNKKTTTKKTYNQVLDNIKFRVSQKRYKTETPLN